MKKIAFAIVVLSLGFSQLRAEDTPFGPEGSGQPTKTVVGILGGAAAGAAIGQGVGGKDGWWIGALTGSALGGFLGNQWGEADAQRVSYRTSSRYDARRPYATKYESVRVIERRPSVVYRVQGDGIPYGFLEGGQVRSPWSDFYMSVGGKTSGQVIYDSNTGQPFRVP
ncbi:MAG: glycine zipper 2TM domain-containing protein [bacterium]